MKPKTKSRSSLLWLFEPLEDDPGYFQKKLFSFDAAYLDNRLYLAVAESKDPWNGLLICTSREHHAALKADFPQLAPHKVLGKWLHLPLSHPEFETLAVELVALTRKRDPRLGVESQLPRQPRQSAVQPTRQKFPRIPHSTKP